MSFPQTPIPSALSFPSTSAEHGMMVLPRSPPRKMSESDWVQRTRTLSIDGGRAVSSVPSSATSELSGSEDVDMIEDVVRQIIFPFP